MSLTRAQWEQMWQEIKAIENNAKTSWSEGNIAIKRQRILNNVESIKNKIQLVIGQME